MAWLEEHRAFIVEDFIKNGGSPVATQRAFRIRFALGLREAVPDKKTIYRWVSNFRQTEQTLEALKEAIRQEVAAITPEMILKFMDNTERGNISVSIFKAATWDIFCSKHIDVKRHSVFFPGIEKHLPYLLWFASQIGEFFLPHPVVWRKLKTQYVEC